MSRRRVLTVLGALLLSLVGGATALTAQDEPGATPLAREADVAIEKGAHWLRRSVSEHGFGPTERSYPLGTRALVAYALLEAGVDHADPFIEELFATMASVELEQVYGVSLYVLALNAWKQRVPPVVRERPGRTAVANDELPGGQDVDDEIERCVAWLVEARLEGTGTWGYGSLSRGSKEPWTDFSNTQFAALALHVGVLHGLRIPERVFEEMVTGFSGSVLAGEDEIEITVDRARWREDEDEERTDRPVTLGSRPISWGYRPVDPRLRRGRSVGWGTVSMTSAGVSTLLVAQHGIRERGRLSRRGDRTIDALVTGGVVELSRAWRPMRERVPGSMHRNIYYTLYSFEKAMDLAGIGVLDGVDWYRAQVPLLLQEQLPDGSWGGGRGAGVSREYRHMSTAFALLFLRRATANLTVQEAAPIVTHGGEDSSSGIATGRVLVPSLGGTIELDELFRRLAESADRELLGVAEEAVHAVTPDERPELLRWLLPLVTGGAPDLVVRFARGTIATITGLPEGSAPATVEDWYERWGRLARPQARSLAVAELGAWLQDAALGVPLRAETITALRRLGNLDAVPFLLGALDDEAAPIRAAAIQALRDLTRADLAFAPEGPAEDRASQAAAWRYWWDSNGEDLRRDRVFAELRGRLERAEDPVLRARVREDLVALGEGIVPRIDRIIAGGSYPFDWVLVRQELTGEAGIPLR